MAGKIKWRRTLGEKIARKVMLEHLKREPSVPITAGYDEARRLVRHYLKGLRTAFKNGSIDLGQ